ncbi:MAG: alkaline phosphatase D family protein, partial [Pseudomonadota bacterium]
MSRYSIVFGAAALVLSGCGSVNPNVPKGPVARALFPDREPLTAERALERYYNTIEDETLPTAPIGKSLPAEDAVVTRILVGSCNDEEIESPALAQIAREDADLFLMVGDNVYGDRDGRAYTTNDPDLTELRASFSDLAARKEFQAVRAKHPMMVAWDDHDFGANDAGATFPFRRFAERVHEHFWGLADEDVGNWDGTYYERSFGPEGQRVQVIMLDTRFFRSDLTGTDAWGEPGKERYIPSDSGFQDMLGTQQWTWLNNQLQKPADIRLIVSSIQILPTVHGYEAWATLPKERERLFDLIKATDAKGVVFVSGDRHTSFLYEDETVLDYSALELTASSLNVSFAEEADSAEIDTRQIGKGYALENFGDIDINWSERTIGLNLFDRDGQRVRQTSARFED